MRGVAQGDGEVEGIVMKKYLIRFVFWGIPTAVFVFLFCPALYLILFTADGHRFLKELWPMLVFIILTIIWMAALYNYE